MTRRLAAIAAAAGLLAAACEKPAAPAPPSAEKHADQGHAHAHSAPNGGTLVALGEHFAQLEFVLDAPSGTLTLRVFDGCAEKPIRIAQPEIRLTLRGAAEPLDERLPAVVSPLSGEKAGDAAMFEARIDALTAAPRAVGEIAEISVRGRIFEKVSFDVPARGKP
jgi:hypothetical protein